MHNEKYGFYDRLSAEFPSQVVVDVTEDCNLECVHCAHKGFQESQFYSGSMLPAELSRKAVDEVRDYGKGIAEYIRYTGEGEPLLHPDLFPILSYAVRESGTMVSLTTNGTLLDSDKSELLLETGVDVVDISIDAFLDDSYAKIRRGGNLRVTRENVLRLIDGAKSTKSKTRVVVSFIEQALNRGEATDFECFWNDAGADYVVVRRMHSMGGALTGIANKMREDNAEKTVRRPCLYPWERIVLNPRGFLSFCPADWTHGSTMIDYHEATIRDIWTGEFYEGLRRAHLANDFSAHAFCGQCPDWAATRWPNEGRSYANMMEEFKAKE